MGTESFPGVKRGLGVTLTPHLLLVPWSWKSRAIPLLPLWAVRPVQSLSACTRVHFTFFNFPVASLIYVPAPRIDVMRSNYVWRSVQIMTAFIMQSLYPPVLWCFLVSRYSRHFCVLIHSPSLRLQTTRGYYFQLTFIWEWKSSWMWRSALDEQATCCENRLSVADLRLSFIPWTYCLWRNCVSLVQWVGKN
jgi:hypothetical protein